MRRDVLTDQAERERDQAERSQVVKLRTVPHGLEAIRETYGWPLDAEGNADSGFKLDRLDMVGLPFPMRLSWDPDTTVTRTLCHTLVANSLLDALQGLRDRRGYEYLRESGLDMFGGVYNVRLKRGNPEEPSTHSWGIAIDINPHLGPLGEEPRMPDWIVHEFTRRGWIWGGNWSYPDGMHFQACSGY